MGKIRHMHNVEAKNVIEILILDTKDLQKHYGILFAETLNPEAKLKFDSCNGILKKLEVLKSKA